MSTGDCWSDDEGVLFAMSVPWLAHGGSVTGDDLQRYFFDQFLFLRSFSKLEEDFRIQLRYWYPGSPSRSMRCVIFGKSTSATGASTLQQFLYSALPRGVTLDL